jgi:hypothetical protein
MRSILRLILSASPTSTARRTGMLWNISRARTTVPLAKVFAAALLMLLLLLLLVFPLVSPTDNTRPACSTLLWTQDEVGHADVISRSETSAIDAIASPRKPYVRTPRSRSLMPRGSLDVQ